ncbi:sister chromatid cohesion protein PDS5-like protein [Striga asiatica]|uniref:Sister chromatid cohesion protein PDS5-like protein n=1 Tax=Striga asiatica TaxID=4170 RepID=A0A5A7PRB7_STRAF|nr:sister chromatid cohesion protein PDS5-like protein [Striga asiatica]
MPPQFSNEELEERLTAAGNSLLQPPSSVFELLSLLDQIEELLSKVEQSPAQSMQTALSPLTKALIMEELVKHSDEDVKDVFQLIVSPFENLSETSSRSYRKRASILETVAKVRSCLIMLDLECDQMINEMFQHFLKAIRDYHPQLIFASMESIMTLVLEESEDISPDLLNPILATLKKNNEVDLLGLLKNLLFLFFLFLLFCVLLVADKEPMQNVLPIAKRLAARVIENSSEKLRPYLAQAVKSLDSPAEDYGEVVDSLCREDTDTTGNNNESVTNDPQVVREGGEGIDSQEKDLTLIESSKSVVSNVLNETCTEDTMADSNISKEANSDHQIDAKSVSKTESDDCSAQNLEKLEANATDAELVEAAKSLNEVEDATNQLSPSHASENENVASPVHSVSLSGESRSEKDSPAKGKEDLVEEVIVSVDIVYKKARAGGRRSKSKKQRWGGKKKKSGKKTVKDKELTGEGASKNEGTATDSETRSLDQTPNNKTEDGSSMSKEDEKKKGHVKPTSGKVPLKSSGKVVHAKDKVSSPRSPLKVSEDEGTEEETPRTVFKRKRTPGTEKVSGDIKLNKSLVGSKVRVWWPMDRKFYEGVVEYFDSVKKKHKVLYNDGEEEVLDLEGERWELIEDNSDSDGNDDAEHSSHDTSLEVQKRKKGNTDSEASKSKRQKVNNTPKSNQKDSAIKSGGKASGSKTKSKSGKASSGKTKDESVKASGGKNKDNSPKTPSHPKQDSQKTAKSKGKTPQSGKNLSDDDGAIMTKVGSSKAKEAGQKKEKLAEMAKSSGPTKGKSKDFAKSRQTEAKSGKKRRR